MFRILDRYIVLEIGPNFVLGLAVFSFVLLLNEILRLARILITQSAGLANILAILANLLPSVLCLTIPMAVLLGILLALGRMSADSEIVALRASGVSLYRLLVPVLVAAALGWGLSSYLMIQVLPDSNQRVRQRLFQILTTKARTDIRPRVFYDNLFPGKVLLVLDIPTGSETWENVFLAELGDPAAPRITLAAKGQLLIDSEKRTVTLLFDDGETHAVSYADPENYDLQQWRQTSVPIQADPFFPPEDLDVPRGAREMHIPELAEKYRQTSLPVYLVEIHKKFSIPFACFVFGVVGLALGITNQKGGRSWGFVVSIAVIFVYYVFIQLGDGVAKQGRLPPLVAMWSSNALLAIAGWLVLARNAREAPLGFRQTWRRFLAPLQSRKPAPSGGGRIPSAGTARGQPSPRRAGRVVVIRIPRPRLRLRFPNTLDRYVAREYLLFFFLVLAALVVVYVLGILVDVLEEAFQHNVKGKLVFSYLGASLPQIFYHMLPLATLMGTLVTFAIFSKTSELVAMKASGVSLYRVSLPVILIGGVVSLACFELQERVLPYSNRRAAELLDEIKRRPVETHNLLDRRWMIGHDQRIYHFSYYDPARLLFSGLAVYTYDPARFSLRSRTYAQQANWDPQSRSWIFRDGWIRDFSTQGMIERFEKLSVTSLEPPEYFTKEERHSDQMTFNELWTHIEDLRQGGFDVLQFEVALHSKISFPLAALITVLIGVPFSFTPGKKGALYGIGIAIAIGLIYYVTTRLFASMGESALLPPWLAAWAPNILFGVAGLYALFEVKT
jgi:LPS export ABC transporter permease LptG/LPS export ABC transporter permease LptF